MKKLSLLMSTFLLKTQLCKSQKYALISQKPYWRRENNCTASTVNTCTKFQKFSLNYLKWTACVEHKCECFTLSLLWNFPASPPVKPLSHMQLFLPRNFLTWTLFTLLYSLLKLSWWAACVNANSPEFTLEFSWTPPLYFSLSRLSI